jgi:DNA mismatch repair protein MutL
MSIALLPDPLISQIAAGEVVERPASVVKELVENALDAGADSIHVAVRGGGRALIRVSDNGGGIPSAEITLAVARHATSKLRTADDLERILTLGFRGEALSSIAAVSQMRITTRHRDETTGVDLRVQGGVVDDQRATGAPAGTVVTVENLFFNTPARLKFLKKESTEKRHITTLVTRYAMAYPDVRFTLEQDGREAFRSSGSGDLADVLVRVLGLDSFKAMLSVEAHDTMSRTLRVEGFTSGPSLHRADRGHITLFINGRWVQDTRLTYAVVQAYHSLLDDGRYPVAALMVEVAPQEVDVNVHPTKAEVRFRDPNAVFAIVQRAVREAVITAGQRPTPRYESAYQPRSPWETQIDMDLPIDDAGRLPRPSFQRAEDADDPTAIPVGAGRPLKPRTLPPLRVVGQVGATYIIAEGPSGLYLIDQNVAHQRVLVDELLDALEAGSLRRHLFDSPPVVDLSAEEMRLLDAHADALTAHGIEAEGFGPGQVRLRSVPAVLADVDPVTVLRGILAGLRSDAGLAAAIAAQGAVRAGQVLQLEQMQVIVRQLERATDPLTGPDGKPTLLHMTGDQIAREFGR